MGWFILIGYPYTSIVPLKIWPRTLGMLSYQKDELMDKYNVLVEVHYCYLPLPELMKFNCLLLNCVYLFILWKSYYIVFFL